MKRLRRWQVAVAASGAAALIACGVQARAGQSPGPDRVVARAGDVFISEREFVERFELLPALYRRGKTQLEGSKLELLYSMIAEKLLAREAEDRNLDGDSAFGAAFLELRKLLARDQLYREEVAGRVTVTPAEVAEERRHAEHLPHIAFLFFPNRGDAEFIRTRITSAPDFDRIRIDSTMDVVRDTATVIWGDADPAIEGAAYALQPGDVSPVVPSGDGYYVLRLLGFVPGTASTAFAPDVFRKKLEDRIRQRKEDRRMHEVIASVIRNATGYSLPGPLRLLAGALMTVFRAESTMTADSMLALSATAVRDARAYCGDRIDDTLVVAGTTRWSVGEVLDRLAAGRFQVDRGMIGSLPATLNGELEYRTQQELLAQEGLRRGLDHRPEVERKLLLWRQAYLASLMKQYAGDQVRVQEGEVWDYLRSVDSSAAAPEVKLRILRTATLADMENALAGLAAGEDFATVVRTWSIDSSARSAGAEIDWVPVTSRPALGSVAALLDSGQRYGPVSVPGGYMMVEVLGKRFGGGGTADSTEQKREEEVRSELLAMKRQGLLNAFIAQSAQRRGYEIYEDRLRAISVSPVPMLTYRILGFGGRMFEVPFVDPQLQWPRIEPPAKPVVP